MWYITSLLLFGSLAFGEIADYLKIVEDKTVVQSIRNVDYIYVINLDHRVQKWLETLDELTPYGIVPYRFSAVNGWKLPLEAIWDVALTFTPGVMRSGAMGTVYRRVEGKEYHSHEIIEEAGVPYFIHCLQRGAIGCILSHLSVIQDGYLSGYEVIWICEDDIEVVRDPHILSQYIDDLDRIVGRENWDIFFTFRDYRGLDGQYYVPYGAIHRPDIDTRDQQKYNIDIPLSSDLRQVGSRFGTQSMIISRGGMEKILRFYEQHKIYAPYDMELVLIPGIKMYSVIEDVVTNKLNVISDLGSTIND